MVCINKRLTLTLLYERENNFVGNLDSVWKDWGNVILETLLLYSKTGELN
jgi:hypothetical protein